MTGFASDNRPVPSGVAGNSEQFSPEVFMNFVFRLE
jgi:hypothetical protein